MTSASELAANELAPIAEFLAQSLPFNELSEGDLSLAVRSLKIEYHPRGQAFDGGTDYSGLRIVRSGAIDLRDGNNELLDRLGEGDSFHLGGLNPSLGEVTAAVIEDALVYCLPDAAYRSLCDSNRHFARHFSGQRSRRLRRAARYRPEPVAMMQDLLSVMSTHLLSVAASATAGEAAAAMARRRVSSALVVEGDALIGILTDRDIRVRLVAKGRPASTPVGEIMTPEPETIDASDTLFDATLQMTQGGYHHLPVKREEELVGMVTTSDLILARKDDPVYLVQHISRQADLDGIRQLVEGVPNLMVQWVRSGLRAEQVSRILTAISDAVTVRLITLAEHRYGPAPAPWSWVGFGSQARSEQLLGADQDNGIIIADALEPGQERWYADVAGFVCDGLDSCGYMYCPGGVMATTAEWRQTLGCWQDTVRRWVRSPTPEAVMRVSIFFDLRCVYGSAELVRHLQTVMLEQAAGNTIFQAALAANVLDSRPPLGIFRRFVVDRDGEHRNSLDIKKRGVLPVTEIVRLHALAHKVAAVNTDDRLQALASASQMSIVDSRNLADALHCIQHQRILHQCAQIARGETVSNYLNPQELPKMAKEQLRDAFTIIDEAQSGVRDSYRAGVG